VLQQQTEPVLPLLEGGIERLEPPGHLTDRVRQHAERVVAPDAGTGLKIARRHASGGGDEPLRPPRPVSLEPEPDGQAERQECQHCVGVGSLVHRGSFNSDQRALV
jgi:hypothetical protein